MSLTSHDYWENHWRLYAGTPQDLLGGCEIYDEIAPFLPPRGEGLSFFEIGCAPGRILADFGRRLGFTASGIDYACDAAIITRGLRSLGVNVGTIEKADFFAYEPAERFDIVASFGFIEHFDDAAAVVDRHFEMVKPGGTVVVAMPNFAGGQKALHWLLDRKNLAGHNTRIMNLRFLEVAAARNGAELVAARYAGGHFDFWVDNNAPLATRRIVWRLAPVLRTLACRLVPGETNSWFSPYLFAIYRAPADTRAETDSGPSSVLRARSERLAPEARRVIEPSGFDPR